jgi:murein DD-endopeptidase MepM/ murein hydrolase activator NlpD
VVPVIVGALAAPVAAFSSDTDKLRDKQKDVQHQIAQAHDHAEESSNKVVRANAALKTSQQKLADAKSELRAVRKLLYAARAKDAQMQARLVAAEAALVQAEADVVAGKQALEEQRAVVQDLVVALYQQGDPTLVSLSGYLGAQTPSDLIRNAEYADTATSKQRGIFDDLTAAEILLRAREDEVEKARDDVADRRAEAAANLVERQTLTDRTEAAKRNVFGLIADNKANLVKAHQARRHDLRVLRQLKREEARIKKQILAAIAAAAAQDGPGYTGASNGYFNFPVAGRVTSPFGYRTHPIYGYYGLHDGTDFGAGCGSSLRAVAAGTVVSAYYSSVYGNRLYVNVGRINGRSVVAVYNHASSYRVRVGERVARGETLGYVGSTGWSTGCHLHFTVLRDGNAVDPMTYL